MRLRLSLNIKYIVAAMLIVFFSSIATLVILNKKPICINSKTISKIERTTQEGRSIAYKCSASKSVPFDENLFQKAAEISRRISDIERFFDDVSPLKTEIELNWIDNNKTLLRVQENKIFISDDLLNKEDVLEASLIRIWLRENSPHMSIDRTILESSLADLILHSLGKLKINSSLDVSWPTNLKTAMAACQAKEISADLLPMCQGNDFGSESIFLGSVRPMISNSMIQAFSKLTLQQSHDLIKQLPEFLKLFSTLPGTSTFSSEETLLDQVAKVEAEISKLSSFLTQATDAIETKNSSKEALWTLFLKHFNDELKKRGWNPITTSSRKAGAIKLEHLILFDQQPGIEFEFLTRIRENQKRHELNGVVTAGRIWFPSSQNWILLSSISQMSSYQIMYVSCEVPSREKMHTLLSRSEKVLYVKRCDPNQSIVIRGYLDNGYKSFAKENPDLAFFQIHSASAFQAFKSNFEIPFSHLALKNWNHPFFSTIGWSTPEWQNRGNFFESRSVIQAIEAYRL